jgi:membrane-bound lytic murein transglycosylase B
MKRRSMIASIAAAGLRPGAAQASDFASFVARLQARAAAAGIPADVIAETTDNLVPNADVIKFDHHQPEFTMTWARFSARVLNAARVSEGRTKYQATQSLLAAVTSKFGVPAQPLMGIWGVETNYGSTQGDFGVIDALTTLAWARNSSYFSGEVIAAMRIVARGDAPVEKLLGSYAGAMGQPQFMPSVYLSTAVSFGGDGQPDIWTNDADSVASIANYLAKSGWQPGLPSSEPVLVPEGLDVSMTGRENLRTIGYWTALGVARLPGADDLPDTTPAALLLPDGKGGQAFLIYANFHAIRAYNPSDFYALCVGALGRMVVG